MTILRWVFGGYYLVWMEKRRLEGREEEGCFALVDIPKLSSCNNEKRQFLVNSLSKSRRNVLNWMVVCHRQPRKNQDTEMASLSVS